MKTIRVWWQEAKARWKAKTPKVFKRIQYICAFIASVALGINTFCQFGGAIMPDWWVIVYPYLLGANAALVVGYQFTRQYGNDGKPIMPDVRPRMPRRKKGESNNTVLDHDIF